MFILTLLIIHFLVLVKSDTVRKKTIEERYIDLLPEGDKLAFLENVARRIRDEIKSNVSPEHSEVEIANDQLNTHGEYVQKVLKEEAENFNLKPKTHRRNEKEHELKKNNEDSDMIKIEIIPRKETNDKPLTDLTFKSNINDSISKDSSDKTDSNTNKTSDFTVVSSRESSNSNGSFEVTKTEEEEKDSQITYEHKMRSDDAIKINDTIDKGSELTIETDDSNMNKMKISTENYNERNRVDESSMEVTARTLYDVIFKATTLSNKDIAKKHLRINTPDSNKTIEKGKRNNNFNPIAETDSSFYVEETESTAVTKNIYDDDTSSENTNKPNNDKKTKSQNRNCREEDENVYQVYEIDRSESPFKKNDKQYPQENMEQIRNTKEIIEEKNSIPVYNYEVNNSFYNAENRFRPDTEFSNKPKYRQDGGLKHLRENKDIRPLNLDYEIRLHDNAAEKNNLREYNLKDTENDEIITKKAPKEENFDLDYMFDRNEKVGITREVWEGSAKTEINKSRFKVENDGRKVEEELKKKTPLKEKPEEVKVEQSKISEEDRHLSMAALQRYRLEDAFGNVMQDMIHTNNEELEHYDWLGSTVDVLSAIYKLIEMANESAFVVEMDPRDEQLLNYAKYLYKSARNMNPEQPGGLPEPESIYPKFLKDIAQMYKENAQDEDKEGKDIKGDWVEVSQKNIFESNREDMRDFQNFLVNLENELRPLHKAIKQIALTTTYGNQNWYRELKIGYLKTENNGSSNLLLHVMTTKLLDAIERSAEEGVEADFRSYVTEKREEVKRSVNQFRLVMNILERIKSVQS